MQSRNSFEESYWTADEDRLLVALVQMHGPRWSRISASFPGRSDSSVRNRYARLQQVPQPEKPPRDRASELPWSTNDDETLRVGVSTYGAKWSTITRTLFPGRTVNAVRNRFHRTLSRKSPPSQPATAPFPPAQSSAFDAMAGQAMLTMPANFILGGSHAVTTSQPPPAHAAANGFRASARPNYAIPPPSAPPQPTANGSQPTSAEVLAQEILESLEQLTALDDRLEQSLDRLSVSGGSAGSFKSNKGSPKDEKSPPKPSQQSQPAPPPPPQQQQQRPPPQQPPADDAGDPFWDTSVRGGTNFPFLGGELRLDGSWGAEVEDNADQNARSRSWLGGLVWV